MSYLILLTVMRNIKSNNLIAIRVAITLVRVQSKFNRLANRHKAVRARPGSIGRPHRTTERVGAIDRPGLVIHNGESQFSNGGSPNLGVLSNRPSEST